MHYSIDDIQPFLWTHFVPDIRYTYILDLEDLDAAFKEFDVDRRNDVRKGQRDGLYCEESVNIEEFMPLLLRSLQAQGIKWSAQRVSQFRDCFAASSSMASGTLFFIRDRDGNLLGGAWLVWDEHRSYYLLAGMDRELGGRTSMPTLIWHMMQFTKQTLGLRWLDVDGADVPQIEAFTRAFGGQLVPCYAATWVSPSIRLFWSLRGMR
jgi:lipid II:glycine glycyltransferase (peptidoglycan interpeptide bridge formation enzyme)